MNIARLRKRGWTEAEIAHALRIFRSAERTHPGLRAMEHAALWLVVCALVFGGIAVTLELLPFLLLGTPAVVVPIVFVVGTCIGLMLVHVLHELKLGRGHQHVGVAVLLSVSIVAVSWVLGTVQDRLGMSPVGAVTVSLLLAAGICIPYLAHWRIAHGPA